MKEYTTIATAAYAANAGVVVMTIVFALKTRAGKASPRFTSQLLWFMAAVIMTIIALLDRQWMGALFPFVGVLTNGGFVLTICLCRRDLIGRAWRSKLDWAIAVPALPCLALLFVARGPVEAALLAVTANVLATVPTIANAIVHPTHEYPWPYALVIAAAGLPLLAANDLWGNWPSYVGSIAGTSMNCLIVTILLVHWLYRVVRGRKSGLVAADAERKVLAAATQGKSAVMARPAGLLVTVGASEPHVERGVGSRSRRTPVTCRHSRYPQRQRPPTCRQRCSVPVAA